MIFESKAVRKDFEGQIVPVNWRLWHQANENGEDPVEFLCELEEVCEIYEVARVAEVARAYWNQ